MNHTIRFVLAAALSLAAASGAWAAGPRGELLAATPAAVPATALTTGEVRKVDTAQGKVTIRHEAIANLDMPPMTMAFRAAKPEQLKDLKAGDKVRFRATSEKNVLIVTYIEVVK